MVGSWVFIRVVVQLAEEAEKVSYWLWIQRKEQGWGHTPPLKKTTGGGGETSPYVTALQPGDGAESETSVSGGLQLMTQQLPKLAPEEVWQSASMDPAPDLCNALQGKTAYSLQQPNKAILKKGECLNKNKVHSYVQGLLLAEN